MDNKMGAYPVGSDTRPCLSADDPRARLRWQSRSIFRWTDDSRFGLVLRCRFTPRLIGGTAIGARGSEAIMVRHSLVAPTLSGSACQRWRKTVFQAAFAFLTARGRADAAGLEALRI